MTTDEVTAIIREITGDGPGAPDPQWALEAIESAGYELRKVGTPIRPEDVQKGDWIRVQYDDGEEFRYRWNSDARYRGERGVSGYFLLDRPAPALPDKPGVRFRAREINSKGKGRVFVTLSTGDIWTDDGIALRDVFERRYTVTEVIG